MLQATSAPHCISPFLTHLSLVPFPLLTCCVRREVGMSCRFSRWEWKSALGSSCPPTLHSMMYPMVQSSGRRMSSEVLRNFLPLEESRAGWVRRRKWGDTGNHFTENQNKPWNKARNPRPTCRDRSVFALQPHPAMQSHQVFDAAPDIYPQRADSESWQRPC